MSIQGIPGSPRYPDPRPSARVRRFVRSAPLTQSASSLRSFRVVDLLQGMMRIPSIIEDYNHYPINTQSIPLVLQDDVYYVHFFVTSQHSAHHGKAIPVSEFRVKYKHQLPNPKLCAWHYAQCARAHIRGFPVQMSARQLGASSMPDQSISDKSH